MPKDTSISLSDRHAAFVEARVKSGDYASADDVLSAGLTLLEEHQAEYEAKVETLRRIIAKSEASGPAREIDWEDFKRQARQRRAERREAEYHEAKAKYLEARAAAETETETPPIRKSG